MGEVININGQIKPKPKTSEEILGLQKPPENTCPDIDSIIRAINKVYNIAYQSKCECREIGDGCGHEDKFYDIQYELTGLEKELEELREANANLRTWGQSWKDLAKQLLNEYEPNWKENKGRTDENNQSLL